MESSCWYKTVGLYMVGITPTAEKQQYDKPQAAKHVGERLGW
jgi:hypothetical protein